MFGSGYTNCIGSISGGEATVIGSWSSISYIDIALILSVLHNYADSYTISKSVKAENSPAYLNGFLRNAIPLECSFLS